MKNKFVTRILAMVLSAALIVPQMSINAMEVTAEGVVSGGGGVASDSENEVADNTEITVENSGTQEPEVEAVQESPAQTESENVQEVVPDNKDEATEVSETASVEEEIIEETSVEELIPEEISEEEIIEGEILPGMVSVFEEAIDSSNVETATVTTWDMLNESAELRADYDSQFRVKPVENSWKESHGHYGSDTLNKAFDENN